MPGHAVDVRGNTEEMREPLDVFKVDAVGFEHGGQKPVNQLILMPRVFGALFGCGALVRIIQDSLCIVSTTCAQVGLDNVCVYGRSNQLGTNQRTFGCLCSLCMTIRSSINIAF